MSASRSADKDVQESEKLPGEKSAKQEKYIDDKCDDVDADVDLRIYKTMALYICFCAVGLSASLIGSTLVHMELIFNTSTKTMAFTFAGHSIGYTIGAWICGVVYERVNKELSFSVSILLQAFSIIGAFFISNLYGYMVAMSTEGLAQGFIDAASQSYCIGLWYNHRLKEPLLQAAHAFWSLGAALGPLIIQQFLVELNHLNSATTKNLTSTISENSELSNFNYTPAFNQNISEVYNSTILFLSDKEENRTVEYTTISEDNIAGIEQARYAYLTIGLLMLLSSVPYIILYFLRRNSPSVKIINSSTTTSSDSTDISTTGNSERKNDGLFNILILILLFTFYYIYLYIENIPSGYFVTFVLQGLSWSVKDATTLVMVFFIFHCAGRFLAIPLSVVFRPRTMVGASIGLVAVAYTLLLFVRYEGRIMWLSASMAGIGMASTFASMVLWTSESVEISGRVASVMLIGSSIGGATGPAMVGYLIDTFDLMWMIYILVISGAMHIVIFVIFIFFFRWGKSMIRDSLKGNSGDKISQSDYLKCSVETIITKC